MTDKLSDERFKELVDKEILHGIKLTPKECQEFYHHYMEIRNDAIDLSTNAITAYYKDILAKYWKVYAESL